MFGSRDRRRCMDGAGGAATLGFGDKGDREDLRARLVAKSNSVVIREERRRAWGVGGSGRGRADMAGGKVGNGIRFRFESWAPQLTVCWLLLSTTTTSACARETVHVANDFLLVLVLPLVIVDGRSINMLEEIKPQR